MSRRGVALPNVLLFALLAPASCGNGSPQRWSGPGVGGTAGAAGFGGTAGADAAPGIGCVDILVMGSTLPGDEWLPGNHYDGRNRSQLWRDGAGVHVAWNATHVAQPPSDFSYPELVVSSYDPLTGEPRQHRTFQSEVALVGHHVGPAPDGLVGLLVTVGSSTAGEHALLVIDTDDPTTEALHRLPAWPGNYGYGLLGIGWDGEAFAVHAGAYTPAGDASEDTHYVMRIAPSGEVLLEATPFGIASFEEGSAYATNPRSGGTFAAGSFFSSDFPYIAGHRRDGAPLPEPGAVQRLQLAPRNWNSNWGRTSGVAQCSLAAAGSGAVLAWGNISVHGTTLWLQLLDDALAPAADVIGVPPLNVEYPSSVTVEPWPSGGFWVAGLIDDIPADHIEEYIVGGTGLLERRTLVNPGQARFDARYLESAAWQDEIWLGFADSARPEPAFRVVRVKPGCAY